MVLLQSGGLVVAVNGADGWLDSMYSSCVIAPSRLQVSRHVSQYVGQYYVVR